MSRLNPQAATVYLGARPSPLRLDANLLVAMLPVLAASVALYALPAVMRYAAAGASAVAGDALWHVRSACADRGRRTHALVIGLLFAMILPPSAPIGVAAAGGLFAALIARALRSRFETYFFHPAALVWALFWIALFFSGHIDYLRASEPRTVDLISRVYSTASDGPEGLRHLALYELPSWNATLIGGCAGGLGETLGIAIIVGGLWLIATRRIRWQTPVAVLLSAAILAACLPIRMADGTLVGPPVVLLVNGFPIGWVLMLYHLTGGGLLLAAMFFAADAISTPLNVRGQVLFGAGIGSLTMLLRFVGVTLGACWWALLVMNALVPAINRVTRRRVWGT